MSKKCLAIVLLGSLLTGCTAASSILPAMNSGSGTRTTLKKIAAAPGASVPALPGASVPALPAGSVPALPGQTVLYYDAPPDAPSKQLCTVPAFGAAACNNIQRTDAVVPSDPTTPPSAIPGLHPDALHSLYGIPFSGAANQTIALVDAYDDPNAEADLAVYRAAFGLGACTTVNGCFRKISVKNDPANLPRADAGWAMEIALDLDMASAICPQCKLLLVEAKSAFVSDLAAAVDVAVANGATVVSNSYYAVEDKSEIAYETSYNHPGIPMTASAGDHGFGATYPASSRYVTAVGATTLWRFQMGYGEVAWSGTASGCSRFIAKPAWQHDTGCAMRTVADIAVVGDPTTGVSVYNTYVTDPAASRGWFAIGGTSVGAPIVAGLYALAGHGARVNDASLLYANAGGFNDIVAGSNGVCPAAYLCTSLPGYDGPTGLGSPKGLAAF